MKNLFVIIMMVMVFFSAAGGEATADSSGSSPDDYTMLVIPAQPAVVQLAFDLAKMRQIMIVAFKVRVNEDQPLLYAWTGSEWQRVGFDDFRSLRFVNAPPATVMAIGDGHTLPKTLFKGITWPCNIERLPTLDPAELIKRMNPILKFNAREWKQLADSYDLEPKDASARQTKPLQNELTAKPAQDAAAAVVPTVTTAAVSNLQMQAAAKPGPDDEAIRGRRPETPRGREETGPAPVEVPAALKVTPKAENRKHSVEKDEIRLDLGDDQYIDLVWIEPLAIWVGRYEITNAQYERFDLSHDPKRYYEHIIDLPDQPVVMVSWEDANNYCGWLNRHFQAQIPAGLFFRLPTESEWTACAKCGKDRTYPWGDNWPPPNSFNYRGMEGSSFFYNIFHKEKFIRGHDDGFVVTAPVGNSGINEWGLYGIGGNVWEWSQDWFDSTKTARAVRGAGWNNHERALIAVSNRTDGLPEKCNVMIGFRVVLAPK